ncbi:MAG: hypothetical protein K1X29_09270 [Bdellovibrionales bacterium]|nr:hypothetical protein [Bdellovibrionales bacterium]
MKQIKFIITWITIMSLSFIQGINCSQTGFNSMDFSSHNEIVPGQNINPDLPFALLNFDQAFQSMLNLTDQTQNIKTSQLNEFLLRESSLSAGNNLNMFNGPWLIATTSLAGEVCNGIIPVANSTNSNRIFSLVNFNGGLSELSDSSYYGTLDRMALAFWSRTSSNSEKVLFKDFRNEFVSNLSSTQMTQAAQTRNLFLATCSAFLSSFDSMTY